MKLRADRTVLLGALGHLQSVVERRTTIPILSNVMMSLGDGRLTLAATDMEIAIVEELAAITISTGACTAPALTLYEIVRRLPEGAEVELDYLEASAQLTLRSGRYRTTVAVLPIEDFPTMAANILPHHFRLSSKALRRLIDRTRFAISLEETRYYLNGIYLHVAGNENSRYLRAVATDGHRLARVDEPMPSGADAMPGIIVPRKAVNELRKLLDGATDDIDISLSDTRIQFRIDRVTLTSKLVDGTFPEYERVIPHSNDKALRVSKKAFAEAVGRVSAISSERSRPVKMSLARSMLVLSTSSPDQGAATEELDPNNFSYDDGPLEIGFQARYLSDIADQIAEQIEFRFVDGFAPTVVHDTSDPASLYVLMPMRV